MKKFAFLGVIGLFIVIYVFVENRINRLTPEQEKLRKQLSEEGKFSKRVNEAFQVNRLSIIVSSFGVEKRRDSTILTVNFMLASLDSSSAVPSSFFKVRSENQEYFYPQAKTIEAKSYSQLVTLRYSLPPTVIPYFLYHLVLTGESPNDKVLVGLKKNYRAEG